MKYLPILAIAALAASLSSCSVIRKLGGDDPAQSVEKTEPAAAPTAKTADKKAPEHKTPRPSDPIRGITTSSMNGQWEITKVGEQPVPALDEMPYLTFDIKEGRFYASNGCNILNGGFRAVGGNRLSFNNVLSTLRMCQDAPLQYEISAVLHEGKEYDYKITPGADGGLVMTLTDVLTRRPSLTLVQHQLMWLNGQWQVASIGAKKFNDPEMNLFFDIHQMTVHGNTGCNFFNGTLTTDPAKACSLNFGNMAVTLRACPDAQAETEMLVALEGAACVKEDGAGQALLLDSDGKVLMVLSRAK